MTTLIQSVWSLLLLLGMILNINTIHSTQLSASQQSTTSKLHNDTIRTPQKPPKVPQPPLSPQSCKNDSKRPQFLRQLTKSSSNSLLGYSRWNVNLSNDNMDGPGGPEARCRYGACMHMLMKSRSTPTFEGIGSDERLVLDLSNKTKIQNILREIREEKQQMEASLRILSAEEVKYELILEQMIAKNTNNTHNN